VQTFNEKNHIKKGLNETWLIFMTSLVTNESKTEQNVLVVSY